jgi:hypothetical protein
VYVEPLEDLKTFLLKQSPKKGRKRTMLAFVHACQVGDHSGYHLVSPPFTERLVGQGIEMTAEAFDLSKGGPAAAPHHWSKRFFTLSFVGCQSWRLGESCGDPLVERL